jgi:hypothetical protein
MPVNNTHEEYDAALRSWMRARDVLAGEDAVKAAGTRYLPRLEGQSDEEYAAYVKRASFFNATARTAEGYCGLIFRRPAFVKLPNPQTAVGRAMAAFVHNADLFGNTFREYAKSVVGEVWLWVVSAVSWIGKAKVRIVSMSHATLLRTS